VVARHEHHPAHDTIESKPANPLSDFLNPNSMITPGAAGAFTMMITNTLCQQFAQLHLGFTGLVVSFLFGAVVFGAGVSVPARMMYYVINSLIIFTVAMGSNAIGDQAAEQASKQRSGTVLGQAIGSRSMGEFNVATVQKPPVPPSSTTTQPGKPSEGQPPSPPEKPKFFRRWF
jgi:hypothetical protein